MTLLSRVRRTQGAGGGSNAGGGLRGAVIATMSLTLAAVLAGHRLIPGRFTVTNVIESALPWLGAGVPPLLLAGLVFRTRTGLVAALVPAVVWAGMFGSAFVRHPAGGTADLRVATQNMYAGNADPETTATALAATKADLIAVQEMTERTRGPVARVLGRSRAEHAVFGTVGLWSRYPIRDARAVGIGMGWVRAMRARVRTPSGDVVVYVAHLDSVRVGHTAHRNATMERLASQVTAEGAGRLLVLGDLNTATTDRGMGALIPPLREAQQTAGRGLGFTWPSRHPLVRPDHVLYRGLRAIESRTLRTPGSDHRAALAAFRG